MNEVLSERGVVPWVTRVPGSSLSPAPRRVLPIVLGMHRSSTSLTAGALHRLGIDMTDGDLAADEFNKGGYYERFHLVELHDRFLESLGSRWDSLSPLAPGWWRDPPALALRNKIVDRLRAELPHSPQRLWGLKDPRLMRLLPLWLDVCVDLDLEPRIILVTRTPEEVAASLARRDNMSRDDALVLWAVYHMEFLQHVGDTPWIRIDGDHWLDDHHAHALRLLRFLGVPTTARDNAMLALDEWVEPEWMTNSRPGRRSRSFAHWLYDRFATLPGIDGDTGVEMSAELRRSAQDFHVFSRVFRPVFHRAERLPSSEAATRDAESKLSAHSATITELHAQLAKEKASLSETVAQRDGAWQEIINLQNRLADLQSALDGKDAALSEARAQADAQGKDAAAARARIAELDGALAARQGERDEARAERDAQREQVAHLTATLSEARAQADAQGKDAATARERIAELEGALAARQGERDEARAQADAQREEVARLTAALSEARTQADDQGKDAAAARARIAELEGALADRQGERDEVRAERDAQREQIAHLTAALSETRAQADAQGKDAAAARERIAELEGALAARQGERDEARAQADAQSKATASLKEQVDNLQSQIDGLEEGLRQAEARRAASEAQAALAGEFQKSAEVRARELENSLQTILEDLHRTQTRNQELERLLAASASAAHRSLPTNTTV
ncbi:hypothetical protein [Azospirillum brasilense]|uniref:hypothetical protein n=1 Tax=Azospirillum brasilense TaxID=192 RepID=UPI000FF05EC8|nr:hypothetical protein [Azospirillum brasilense]NUB24862.1 hypothetical protein [Azospirillum brasilense]NUB32537.1 hypothetical protein [Azospirillum brasilense]RIW02095.1 hypothetical protein D2T81_16695 [Azospirillum brasilense]